MFLYSIIIPVLNEEDNIQELYEQISKLKCGNDDYRFEFIFVDDGSTDNSFNLLKEISKSDDRVKIISLSKNFGGWNAISAGIEHAKGDAVTWISADLQEPPDLIPRMIEKWKEGYKIVFATRSSRKDPISKKLLASFFYKLLRRIALPAYPSNGCDICLIDKRVVEHFKSFRERNRFVVGILLSTGFEKCEIPYERRARKFGESKWSTMKSAKLALDAIISFSYSPLRLIIYTGFAVFFVSIIMILNVIIEKLFMGIPVAGYSSLMIAILFFGGLHAIMLGIIGEYLWRILEETKQRPLYIINDKIGFEDTEQVPQILKKTHSRFEHEQCY